MISVVTNEKFVPGDAKGSCSPALDSPRSNDRYGSLETARPNRKTEVRAMTPPLPSPADDSVDLDHQLFFALARGSSARDSPEPQKPLFPDVLPRAPLDGDCVRWPCGAGSAAGQTCGKPEDACTDRAPGNVGIKRGEMRKIELNVLPVLSDSQKIDPAPQPQDSSEDTSSSAEASVIINDCPFLSRHSPSFELYGLQPTAEKRRSETVRSLASPCPQGKHKLSLKIAYPRAEKASVGTEPDLYCPSEEVLLGSASARYIDWESPFASPREVRKTARVVLKQTRISDLLQSEGATTPSSCPVFHRSLACPTSPDQCLPSGTPTTQKKRKSKRKLKPLPQRLISPLLGLNKDGAIAQAYGMVSPKTPAVKKRSQLSIMKRLPVY